MPQSNTGPFGANPSPPPQIWDDLAKNDTPNSTTFNALSFVTIPLPASIGGSVATTTIQAELGLPKPAKVKSVSITATGASISGAYTFNVVYGNSTAVTTPQPSGQVAAANAALFATDQAITINPAGPVQVFIPDNPDVIYGPNATPNDQTLAGSYNYPITVRLGTPAATLLTNATCTLALEPFDLYPSIKTANPKTDY